MGRRLLLLAIVAAAFSGSAAPAHAVTIPWCGSGEPTTDVADDVNAFEWHIVYAVPNDGIDRFAAYAPRFAGDVAVMSNWWLGQDATRRPRFDLVAGSGCPSDPYGRVDISFARLPQPNSAYSFQTIVNDLRAAGFTSPDKGYLVYYDGSLHVGEEFGLCGQGRVDRQSFAYAIVYLQSCEQSFGDDLRATIAVHEMTHGMGAVPSTAPHACQSGHVCDGPDLMKSPFDYGDSLATLQLDPGRDDYYAHSGNWWDVQDSGLLYKLDTNLEPAPSIVGLTATSSGNVARVEWKTSPAASNVSFRLYDAAGNLVGDGPSPVTTATGEIGQLFTWTVRAWNAGGFLSPPATVRFKLGYGIVDASGALVRDTVLPGQVFGLRATRAGKQALLRWSAVSDPIGLKGYRVSAPGLRTVVVRGTSLRLSARGKKVTVAAVDQAGNVGPPATVRAPR
jgi:hypothetical protein